MSPLTYQALHRLGQFLRVETNAVLEYELNIFDVLDVLRGIARNDHQIGRLAGGDRADLIAFAQISGAILCGDMNGLDWREACLDQQLQSPLIAIAGQNTTE